MKKSKIVIGGIAASFLLAACAVPATETATEKTVPAPAPVERVVEQETVADPYLLERIIFKEVWAEETYADQAVMCEFAIDYPSLAFEAYDEASEQMLPRSVFFELIDEVC